MLREKQKVGEGQEKVGTCSKIGPRRDTLHDRILVTVMGGALFFYLGPREYWKKSTLYNLLCCDGRLVP